MFGVLWQNPKHRIVETLTVLPWLAHAVGGKELVSFSEKGNRMNLCPYRPPVEMKLFWNSSRSSRTRGTCFAAVGPQFRKEYKMTRRLAGSKKQHNILEEKMVYGAWSSVPHAASH